VDGDQRYVELLKRSLVDLLGSHTSRAVPQDSGAVVIEDVPEGERVDRLIGRDWPDRAATMIGLARLTNLQACIETIVAERVPGHLIEAGIWRGGATVFMRALLDLRGETDRLVWAADSFQGLPEPDPENFPADAGDAHHTVEFLAVSLAEVRRNFSRYDIPTTGIRFLEGWFRDTLPSVAHEQWALVRLDGDMYESTMEGLDSLYQGLSPGGFIVIDDYGAVDGCRQAVDEFRYREGIDEEMTWIDWTGVVWRKRPQ
jgi:O-methyltransferase